MTTTDPGAAPPLKWFVRGDIDGFFGLALDNLVQLLLIDALSRTVLGLSTDLVHGTILPGVALSLLVGNLFYARQALQLAAAQGRSDVCALPYGINTVSLFAHVFLVMLPAKLAAEAAGHPDPPQVAWQAGLIATLGSGVIELGGAFVAKPLLRLAPRAALLSTLAGIALGFIGMGFLFRIYARPVVGLSTLGVVLLTYFGRVRFRGGLPGGLVAVCLGCALSWAMGLAPVGSAPDAPLTLRLPHLALGEIAGGLAEGMPLTYFSVILPMGLFNLIGSLQNLESAKAAGDDYPEPQSLAVNGAGTLVAAAFGSCFPTTLYIGHPGWKSMGARSGYSTLNALFFLAIALSGSLGLIAWAIPLDAGIAIVLWIGVVITAQAFQATPKHHAPAVVIGLLPGVAAWGTLMAKNGLRAGGVGAPGGPSFGPDLLERFLATDTWIEGAFALEQGFIFTAMILTSATVAVIERQFCRAALWCCAGAAGSLTGLMHSFQFSAGDVVLHLVPATRWAVGYLAMAAVFLLARWVTVATDTVRS